MNITRATRAPSFIHVPAAAVAAVLDHVEDKGAQATFLYLTMFLWGDRVLEGEKHEWLQVTGLASKTFERHLSALGHSGCLRYSQPRRGYWTLLSFVENDEESELLRQCWQTIEAGPILKPWDIATAVEALFTQARASKMTRGIIHSSTSTPVKKETQSCEKEKGIISDVRRDASKMTRQNAPKTGALRLPEAIAGRVVALGWQGSLERLARIWATSEPEAERIENLLAYHERHPGQYAAALFWQEVRDNVTRAAPISVEYTGQRQQTPPAPAPAEPEIWREVRQQMAWTLPQNIMFMLSGAVCVQADAHSLVVAVATDHAVAVLTHPKVLPRIQEIVREVTGNGTVVEFVCKQ